MPLGDRRPLLLLGLVVLLVGVLSMPAEQYVGDPLAVRVATWSLLENGRLDVPEAQVAGERGQYFVQNPETGRWYSKYGELNTVGYLPAMMAEKLWLGRLDPVNNAAPRTLLLNLGNLLLSLVLAALLYALARQYAEPVPAVLFTLASLYATFGWNYLRAQTTELLQWTLYTGFFLAWVRAWRTGTGHGLAVALLALLLLTKLVYALLIPLLLPLARRAPWILAPLALACLAVLGLNELKFGGAFVTGYTQWTREAQLFHGNLAEGVLGFLFDPQRSVILYDPLLLLALPALPAFFRRHPAEALAAWLPLGAFLLLHAQTINWAGHWSYGPRYLLPVLTPASLAALEAFRWLEGRRLAAAAVAVILAASLWMQAQVNRLQFFTYYGVEAAVKGFPAPAALATVERTPFGLLNAQLVAFRDRDRVPPFLQAAARELPPEQLADLARAVRDRTRGNLWWF